MTVAEAMIAYITDFKARGGRTLKDTEANIKAHILPTLGDKRIDALTFTAVKQWHHRVAVARKPPLNGKSGFTILDSPDAITMNGRGVTEHRIMARDELLGAQFPSRDLILDPWLPQKGLARFMVRAALGKRISLSAARLCICHRLQRDVSAMASTEAAPSFGDRRGDARRGASRPLRPNCPGGD